MLFTKYYLGDQVGNIVIKKKKMNLVRSLLDDIKTIQLQWCGHVQRMEEGRLPKEVQGKVAVVLAEIRALEGMPK